MATFREFESFTGRANYVIDVPWGYLKETLRGYSEDKDAVQLNPDFQRGHVWSESQQVAFVEFKIKGGMSGSYIYFNHPGWMRSYKGDFVLVDGLQRLTAVLRFLDNEIPAFGVLFSEFEDKPNYVGACSFRFAINNLQTRAEVLKWYLELNAGGTPHSERELNKVRRMIKDEGGKG
jgi:hypothetical protein